MDKDELNLEELEKVTASPNNLANSESAMNNKDLYREAQIEELEKLKANFLNQEQQEENSKQR